MKIGRKEVMREVSRWVVVVLEEGMMCVQFFLSC
jgi:hypothetical protein